MASTGRLNGQVALVTGAGGGLGRAEAVLLAQQGAQVVVNNHLGAAPDLANASAAKVAAEIRAAGGEAVAHIDTIATPEGACAAVRTAIDTFGRLDIVINNAGTIRIAAAEETTDEQWNDVLHVSLFGTFYVCRTAIPHLGPGAVILNTGSEAGYGGAYMSAYATAKAGVIGLSQSLARELAPRGIRCNTLMPRVVGTSMGARTSSGINTYGERMAALGRYAISHRTGTGSSSIADEAAALAVWLCTPAAGAITGHTFSNQEHMVEVWSPPQLARIAVRSDDWTLDALDEQRDSLLPDAANEVLARIVAQAGTIVRSARDADSLT